MLQKVVKLNRRAINSLELDKYILHESFMNVYVIVSGQCYYNINEVYLFSATQASLYS